MALRRRFLPGEGFELQRPLRSRSGRFAFVPPPLLHCFCVQSGRSNILPVFGCFEIQFSSPRFLSPLQGEAFLLVLRGGSSPLSPRSPRPIFAVAAIPSPVRAGRKMPGWGTRPPAEGYFAPSPRAAGLHAAEGAVFQTEGRRRGASFPRRGEITPSGRRGRNPPPRGGDRTPGWRESRRAPPATTRRGTPTHSQSGCGAGRRER